MQFSPFNFQAPLAAGGVTLMAFNWLQFSVPHGQGSIHLSDIGWSSLAAGEAALIAVLIAIMFVMMLVNLGLTVVFVKDLTLWLARSDGYREFMASPPTRVTGTFVPIASLAMTVAVVLAAFPFFIPSVAVSPHVVVLPASVLFAVIWFALFGLEFRVTRNLFARRPDPTQMNFVWLLDAFAFGLVALAGTALASAATDEALGELTAIASTATVVVGSVILLAKLVVLAYGYARSHALPEKHLQPAFFLLAPIACLYAISYYRLTLLFPKSFGFDLSVPTQTLVAASYVFAVGWLIYTVYLLADYFRTYFRKSEYFPTQWAMV